MTNQEERVLPDEVIRKALNIDANVWQRWKDLHYVNRQELRKGLSSGRWTPDDLARGTLSGRRLAFTANENTANARVGSVTAILRYRFPPTA